MELFNEIRMTGGKNLFRGNKQVVFGHVEFKITTRHMIRPTPIFWASQVVLVVKSLLANVGDIRDTGLIPRSGRSL